MGVQGYDEDQIALVIPGFVQLCGMGPCDPGNLHNKLHCECDKGEIDRCPGNPLGQHLNSLSPGSKVSYCHGRG